MKSIVIVCTRNRPEDVSRVLESCAAQVPPRSVMVVDSSDGEATREVVERWDDSVSYLRAERGLTRQRMAGVRAAPPDVEIVHFIDDDVVLEPEYFAEIERAFERHRQALGVGGVITNLAGHNPWWMRRLFGLDSARGGVVLPSGVNVLVFHADDDVRTDWLSGCAMSYRRFIFDTMSFDTSMEGYSLGEDVEFSYRVSRVGEVWVTPGARLKHLTSPVEREAQHLVSRREVVARYRRVSEMRGQGLTLAAFWWGLFGDVVLSTMKGVVRVRRYPIRRAVALLAAVADIARMGRVGRIPPAGKAHE